MRNQKERRVLEHKMMLSTTFIGRLQKLYHTSLKNLPRESKKRKKKKKAKTFYPREKREAETGSEDDQQLPNPLTLHTNLQQLLLV